MLIFLGNVEQMNNAGQNIAEVCYGLVRKERKEKADKIKFEKQRNISILAGMLLNYATGEYERRLQDANNDDISLEKVDVLTLISSYNKSYDYELTAEANGKPVFKNRDDIYFNVSHSGSYVVCAVNDRPVGIDIEGERKNVLKIAKRFFTQKEYNWVVGIDDDFMTRFLRIWTMKEAYSKLTGIGIAYGISEMEFLPDEIMSSGNGIDGTNEYNGLYIWESGLKDDCNFRISVITYSEGNRK